MTLENDEAVINAIENEKPDNLIRLSSGVVLVGKPANPVTLIAVLSNMPRPVPPTYHNDKMGRDMENPDDPDYVSRVQMWQTTQADAMITAFILLGTELHSKPKKMPGPYDPDWLEDFLLLGMPSKPDSKKWRYLTWVKTQACLNTEDQKLIQEVVGRLSGVSRKDVQAAEEFSRREETPG